DARIVSTVATLFSVSPENVAMPLTADTVTVPPRVAPAGLFPRDNVTGPLKLASTAPAAVRAVTTRPNGLPAATLIGGAEVTRSCVAAASATLIAVVAADTPGMVWLTTWSVVPVPALLNVSPLKFATPLTAATVVVPPSVAPLGLLRKE